ncbi:hypothetical protein AB0I95_14735 [Micromonospora sp. NPDC049751]|uniref:hypothetical protein n=1 Tax=Micromonospora sp. NPDC049751 TaxID=3154837 RepID=UPI0033DD0ECE
MSSLSTQAPPPRTGPRPAYPRFHNEGQQPHTPLRPMWMCRADGQVWPCGEARLRLKAEFEDNYAGLTIYLAGMLYEAARDLYHLNPHDGPPPGDLFARFVGWTPYRRPIIEPPSTPE